MKKKLTGQKKHIKKKRNRLLQAFLFEYDEGLCVQIMHMGSYDDEPSDC